MNIQSSYYPNSLQYCIHHQGLYNLSCQIVPFKPYSFKLMKEKVLRNDLNHKYTTIEDEILFLSNGSPELLIKNIENLSSVPEELWNKIKSLKNESALFALSIAKDITEILDFQQQLLLIDWMQQYYWRETTDQTILKKLEKLKLQLESYINPRIAWEVALINLIQ